VAARSNGSIAFTSLFKPSTRPGGSSGTLSWASSTVKSSFMWLWIIIYLTISFSVHYQGIIHRDIKPANLLWTADRSKVKISDFGVSHFSYAQRLAAAGQNPDLDTQQDPILLDDSDLSKTAGTPSFLAPEVVFDYSTDTSPINSVSNTLSSLESPSQPPAVSTTRREPITKAIDIWALGVTLYCLLFGKVPFAVKDGNEWALYKLICTQDWAVPDKMGFDQLETGGRRPKKRDTEGFIVMNLLNDLLQKDVKQRATLDQVKVRISPLQSSF